LVNVPEADNAPEGFEAPSNTDFDIEAQDFEALGQNLGYRAIAFPLWG
jgi:hypothetical protein